MSNHEMAPALLSERRIRNALVQSLETRHRGNPDALVIEELVLAIGSGRVDVAVVNGNLHAFEIKSDFDRLERLATQAPLYSSSFDAVTLVYGPKLAAAVTEWVPDWWELIVVDSTPAGLTLRTLRPGHQNPSLNSMAVAGLLWKAEALALLPPQRAYRLRNRPRPAAWAALAELLSPAELSRKVAETLRGRQGWRAGRSRR